MTDYKITVPPYIEHIKGIPQVCNGWKTPRKRYGKRLIRRIERAYPQQQQWIRNYCENHNEQLGHFLGLIVSNIQSIVIRSLTVPGNELCANIQFLVPFLS